MTYNPIFSALNQKNMLAQFDEFKRTFKGDPKAEVQRLLDSGQMSQEQFGRLSEMANQFQMLIGK